MNNKNRKGKKSLKSKNRINENELSKASGGFGLNKSFIQSKWDNELKDKATSLSSNVKKINGTSSTAQSYLDKGVNIANSFLSK